MLDIAHQLIKMTQIRGKKYLNCVKVCCGLFENFCHNLHAALHGSSRLANYKICIFYQFGENTVDQMDAIAMENTMECYNEIRNKKMESSNWKYTYTHNDGWYSYAFADQHVDGGQTIE